jgi:hypothetical protein
MVRMTVFGVVKRQQVHPLDGFSQYDQSMLEFNTSHAHLKVNENAVLNVVSSVLLEASHAGAGAITFGNSSDIPLQISSVAASL